jgi:hypothetical protein
MGKGPVETHEFLKMLRRMVRAAGTRVGRADPEDLAELIAIRIDLDAAIQRAVDGLREDGFTWQSIGDATGTSRQAALMKWRR